ncbi:NAD(P)-binding protein [Violaceomyces palustris]|uniref:NAD(P)-binding protein n=1 Tax=Violaceomyces palustris TaxID=1673888 RepID=A0ACD0NQS0_9BASI|nr:NAD(P)-binding protein [Violaceomyces palustris]
MWNKAWDPKSKNVFITGGSQGLGLALAQLLASKGANVTICSRSEEKLIVALGKVKQSASSTSQKIDYVASDVSTFQGAKRAVDSCQRVPDAVFCCAGGAKPGFFLQQTEEDFQAGMKTDYWTCLATSHAAANVMARNGIKGGKIVLVSSVLGFMGLVGYSQYTPMKHAIRGLAESLRSELQLYGISVHAYFPATILSPGFEEENKTKPKITKQIEGVDEGLTPEVCAKGLLKGIEQGHFFITTDFVSDLFRVSANGSAPSNNWFLDGLIGVVASVGLPIWRILIADRAIKSHVDEHRREMGLK